MTISRKPLLVALLLMLIPLGGCARNLRPTAVPNSPTPAPFQLYDEGPPVPASIAERFPNIRVLVDAWTSDIFYYDLNGTDVDPSLIPRYWYEAGHKILGIRPGTSLSDPLPATIFVFMPTENVNPATNNPGFDLAPVALPWDLAAAKARYPYTEVDGKTLVMGYTRIEPGVLIVIYVLADAPEVIRHEALHALWFMTWPAEHCEGTNIFTYTTVEHGFGCDPFQEIP